ncbi:hypothetical protein [Bradyrhizobium sp. SZCCHNRI3043]|uniref:hypothetical protein n=1 Tax=Bradyrhizobium sp. SZCCHNRI3043 TaxID=3057292 RepID=UPI0028F0510F|nr:hypothetical protein [Bradyrhizobium sp. SZCCHNRI3043]
MQSDSARTAAAPRSASVLQGLQSFADEVCGTFARLFAYVGALALIAMLGVAGWNHLDGGDDTSPGRAGWTLADGAVPAFSLRLADQPDRTATYTVLIHPEGGRKDVLRWGEPADRPAAELEVYRLGVERDARHDPRADLALRMGQGTATELETAGVIDSRFGPVSLVRRAGAPEGAGACLGFLKTIAEPSLRISGWSCQGVTMPARRAMVGCMLNRLTLLAPDQNRALSQLFMGTDQRRGGCDEPAIASGSGDWVTSTANPRLRGAL